MPFLTVFKCTECNEVLETLEERDSHDCPVGDSAIARGNKWREVYEVNKAVWESWRAKREQTGRRRIKYAIESVDQGPDDVAVEGTMVLASYNDEWGGGDQWHSKPITNPTWGQVLVALDKAIRVTGDRHHVFMEGLENTGRKHRGVTVWEIHTGS
jgi:predicted RNA-binding Zn-ribbon protein involved in translation (DUF1610 family)